MGPRRTGSDWAVRWGCAWIGYTDMDSSVRGARDGTLGRSSRRSVSTGSAGSVEQEPNLCLSCFFDLLRSRHLGAFWIANSSNKKLRKIEQSLSALRVAERNLVIPLMNGDFTQWDLYLASSSEYAMRLIDGFISMLESRNLVCVAQLLRAQVGVCLRTFALFAAEDQDDFLPKGCQVPWRERWGSHHSAWIHPDAHRSRRFQRSRISRAGNRRGQATPYSCRRRSRLCRGFLP